MTTVLTTADLYAWVDTVSQLMSQHAAELTDLDAAIGDADHGTNMNRGFTAAAAAVREGREAGEMTTPDALLKQAAMTLISTVGGASGPLYGTCYLRMATALRGREAVDLPALVAAVDAGIDGIAQRGKATAGEKTMLDAWLPVAETLRGMPADASLEQAMTAAAEAAARGRDATKDMKATKGRASYLGERSVGHIDPGAASTALLWQAIAQVLSEADQA